MTRRIQDTHDDMLFRYDWKLKYLHQKAGVANAERHFIRLKKAEEKLKNNEKKKMTKNIRQLIYSIKLDLKATA